MKYAEVHLLERNPLAERILDEEQQKASPESS